MTDEKPSFNFLINSVMRISKSATNRNDKLKKICILLKDSVHYYDWVGFYLADPDIRELRLGPYVGEPTEHIKIPFGTGICGQAAVTLETFIVQDVAKENNYLACSPVVRAEIVIPVMKGNKFVAELDIDSHQVGAFNDEDRDFLENVANIVGQLF